MVQKGSRNGFSLHIHPSPSVGLARNFIPVFCNKIETKLLSYRTCVSSTIRAHKHTIGADEGVTG